MGNKHRHYDVIVAWAAGEEIERWHYGSGEWLGEKHPSWFEDIKYRIKPKRVKKEGWVNVYGSRNETRLGHAGYVYATKGEADAEVCGKRKACIRIEWEEEA